ncbi:YPDG domain-containing protein, partial [Streptococcus mitis]|uniref:YPDG domain-containing protein n=1 Tax=Streptococcus mitis TaxID=28037 RepID=UPI0021B66367
DVDKDGKVTVTIPEGSNPGDKITGKVLVRYPDGSTEEIPVTVTVTSNANYEDTKTTMDNGDKSNDSQNVLPNTGTESNATLASLGLLGMLGGLGLVARKKKED